MKLSRKQCVILLVCPLMILLDQLTKQWVHTNMDPFQIRPVITGYLSLHYLRNSGLIWGLFAKQLAGYSTWVYLVINLAALAIILRIFFRTQDGAVLLPLALSLVLAGALGNLIDRLRWGYVVDFIQMYYITKSPHRAVHSWAIYNVADICITFGIIFLLLDSLRPQRRAD